MENKTVKVETSFDRIVLNEARNYGLGFAFAKKESDDVFKTVHIPSTCKDYLNDIIAVEKFAPTKVANVYGLSYSATKCFEEDGSGYLFIHVLDVKGNSWRTSDLSFNLAREIKNLHEKIHIVEKTLHEFENMLPFDKAFSTKIYKVQNNEGYLLHLHPGWITSPFMISICALVIRVAQYNVETPSYTSVFFAVPSSDTDLLKSLKPRLQWIIQNNQLPSYNELIKMVSEDPSTAHGNGINSSKLPNYGGGYSQYYTDGSLIDPSFFNVKQKVEKTIKNVKEAALFA